MQPTQASRLSRRDTLAGMCALGVATWLQGDKRTSPVAPRTLLIVQLAGGNDGLSMVVPHGDDGYHSVRPNLRHSAETVLALDDYRGLHPALKRLREVYASGSLALVEGVGYPNPIRSHFQSFDVWHAGDPRGRSVPEGWVGRFADAAFPADTNPNLIVHVGGTPPYSLHSASHPPAAFVTPAGYRWAGDKDEQEAYANAGMEGAISKDREGKEKAKSQPTEGSSLDFLRKVLSDGQASSGAIRRAAARYQTPVAYPDEAFATTMRHVAALVNGGLGTRVFSAELGGFDTHTDQKNRHDQLMRRLDGALGALLEDLQRTEAGKQVVVMVFSEFGRRVKENGSRGTDHGVAAPMFVMGAPVKGGLYGKHPSLTDLDDGDLSHTTDFRSVYGSLLESWFGVPHERVLGKRFELIDLV